MTELVADLILYYRATGEQKIVPANFKFNSEYSLSKVYLGTEENNLVLDILERRKKLLQETDYTALTDVTLSPEMAAYRQALRDIPQQDGFPFETIWPVKPI